ncbi:SMI1/KNR4 family protein [Roseofilum sp. Guam]|uniref:SMI1/KNR4 family protein n=1 Tax=Roseofilum sp. Guam TaxID=2821502 RepID=UPI001B1CB6D8|nr:SMI1/KNR4 family protein [Roseofilum sp. Guam]MBP0029162.1 SMI1/KNR4 family protein [Roseofilum sp. Guam]
MTTFNWESLLKELSHKLIEGRGEYDTWELTPEILASRWLGKPGASEDQITLAETRLETRFPPSYREFLKISNGWRNSDWTDLQLWSTEEIEWFSIRNQDWIWPLDTDERPSVPDDQYFVYGEAQDCVHLRCEYLQTALEISSNSGDGDIFLLIPDVVFEDGEWEAWHFGNKLPGANRYRSFYELMFEVTEQGRFIY